MLSRRCCLRYRMMTTNTMALRMKSPPTMQIGSSTSTKEGNKFIHLSVYWLANLPPNISESFDPILFSFLNRSLNHKSTGPLPCTASISISGQSLFPYPFPITVIIHYSPTQLTSVSFQLSFTQLKTRSAFDESGKTCFDWQTNFAWFSTRYSWSTRDGIGGRMQPTAK